MGNTDLKRFESDWTKQETTYYMTETGLALQPDCERIGISSCKLQDSGMLVIGSTDGLCGLLALMSLFEFGILKRGKNGKVDRDTF